jgi:glycosyltransferase involved in cell wall biosynthesis
MTETVSIILPVHNQADHIGNVLKHYLEALGRTPYQYEILLIVNGCRDKSLEICHQLETEHQGVQVIFSEKGGWGLAVRLGLEAARGNYLCYTNSARTAPQDLLLVVLYAVANPGTVVKAHRRSRESFTRKLGSFLYNLQCRVLFNLATWDVNATPKAFSRSDYENLCLESNGDLIDLEFFIKCKQQNIVILEVPTYSWIRHSGNATTTFRSAFNLYKGAFDWWQKLRKEGYEVPHLVR